MKLVTYAGAAGPRLGAILGESVVDLAALGLPDSMLALIEGGPALWARAKAALSGPIPDGARRPLAGTALLAPLPRTPKGVIGIGLNYAKHVDESARTMQTDATLPTHPVIFIKPNTCIVGPDAEVVCDEAQTRQMDWEAELAVVIGARCKHVREEDWREVVFGYTVVNDISARDLRHGGQWTFAKGQDGYAPMGPCIVTADEIADPHSLAIGTRVNGVEKQNGNTAQMIFKTGALIAHLTSGITLEPGDVIATGTPDGVGISRTPPEFMKPGDVCEVWVEGIGTLRTFIVAPRR
ncbi:MAG: fumarylacetoacetate hydrolase family protein [Acetobacteraceae bacterium]|nr:fumarylacetoacetate hydrolase family protein [Acetobacteraceae bacterium]MCX7685918.1 fumarylacetoacetate hydrolase family protein [Acetobacteraceae bacterium]